jgi:DNA-nicking Smr family endonuclease
LFKQLLIFPDNRKLYTGRMSKSRGPSDADIELFRNAVGEVRPIKSGQHSPAGPRAAPVPRQLAEDERAVVEELLSHEYDAAALETGEELLFQRPGLRKNVLRNLRRGQYVVADELDLHGMTADEARDALGKFIKHASTHGNRCIRVVHGKGRRSSNQGPVLKPLVNRWLRLRDEVLAFCSARAVDGGTGAVYVLLRKR